MSRRPDAVPPPSVVPPIEVYKTFLRMRKTRFGTLWKLVRDGLDAADEATREWAVSRRDNVAGALDAMLSPPSLMTSGRVPRVRGAVRTRGADRAVTVRRTSHSMAADVVTSDSQPAGASVEFQVLEPPHTTGDGRFRVRLRARAADYGGQIVLCTVKIAGAEPVSFTGVLARADAADAFEVRIDEPGVGDRAGQIPADQVSLFVTRRSVSPSLRPFSL